MMIHQTKGIKNVNPNYAQRSMSNFKLGINTLKSMTDVSSITILRHLKLHIQLYR